MPQHPNSWRVSYSLSLTHCTDKLRASMRRVFWDAACSLGVHFFRKISIRTFFHVTTTWKCFHHNHDLRYCHISSFARGYKNGECITLLAELQKKRAAQILIKGYVKCKWKVRQVHSWCKRVNIRQRFFSMKRAYARLLNFILQNSVVCSASAVLFEFSW